MRDLIIRCCVVLLATAIVGWGIVDVTNKSTGTNAHAASQSALPSDGSLAVPSLHASATAPADSSPLLDMWQGPYGGVPPFDRVQVALFKPALEAAMTENIFGRLLQLSLVRRAYCRCLWGVR